MNKLYSSILAILKVDGRTPASTIAVMLDKQDSEIRKL